MNVSSIIVQVKSDQFKTMIEFFKECEYCDYYFSDEKTGKIIITIEGENTQEEVEKLRLIQGISGVISAEMMMSCNEDELDLQREKIKLNSDLIDRLNTPLDAKDISYQGDLKKSF